MSHTVFYFKPQNGQYYIILLFWQCKILVQKLEYNKNKRYRIQNYTMNKWSKNSTFRLSIFCPPPVLLHNPTQNNLKDCKKEKIISCFQRNVFHVKLVVYKKAVIKMTKKTIRGLLLVLKKEFKFSIA
ncbi:hypothetical protein BpHYR1_001431 [Brachionus plicatilis]|uniref:Uncharacterized protein n=1 Tax=Brachionus plicatilis TaxID=10195 RepID=A0A3M7PVT4_BRAPC|nr:hypothetical protein BpHYR1_001431 [Brachionus plicatilis]